ncbi:60S ribosomal protein L13a-4-like [Prunus avium]|uniref:60S ribosomal protein L13a-4-like n=1 Tax=Prunus avium TaxID=42229 RepID=A0A6P5SZL0_PRUAV|nr:60S ribosomal protein L13a-4-like [Prunus avium]
MMITKLLLGTERETEIFYRCVFSFISLKTKRGAAALARLKAYEGVQPPYDKMKRMELENKRKERAQLAYERKKQLNKLMVKAEKEYGLCTETWKGIPAGEWTLCSL